jgi:hypothetical protein
MANARRGEIEAVLDGRTRTLCLTLGALAELEGAFGVDDLDALGRRLGEGRLSARDLVKLLGAGVRGGGAALTDDEVAAMLLAGGLPDLIGVVGRLLEAAFGGGVEGGPPGPRRPQGA